MHGKPPPPPKVHNATHARLALLTAEYIDATPERQAEIDGIFDGVLSGDVVIAAGAREQTR